MDGWLNTAKGINDAMPHPCRAITLTTQEMLSRFPDRQRQWASDVGTLLGMAWPPPPANSMKQTDVSCRSAPALPGQTDTNRWGWGTLDTRKEKVQVLSDEHDEHWQPGQRNAHLQCSPQPPRPSIPVEPPRRASPPCTYPELHPSSHSPSDRACKKKMAGTKAPAKNKKSERQHPAARCLTSDLQPACRCYCRTDAD